MRSANNANSHTDDCRKAFRDFRESKNKLISAQSSCPECKIVRERRLVEAKETVNRR